jgi:hypothetical protein
LIVRKRVLAYCHPVENTAQLGEKKYDAHFDDCSCARSSWQPSNMAL